MSETDKEFVADMEWLHSHDREAALPPEKLARLFALARCGADAADEIERLKAELLERDAVWLPEKDAEIERLRTLLKAIRNFPNLSTHYGTLTVAEIDAALKEDGE